MKWIIIKNNWKKFKWRFYSKRKKVRILSGRYSINVKGEEDKDGNYNISWELREK